MKQFTLRTQSRTDFIKIDRLVAESVREMGLNEGLATIFIPHTTAGITINENADPDVTTDLEQIMDRMIPWKAGYRHAEGNSAAHAKASLMGSSVQVIISAGQVQLGTWQSLYFCEFDGPRSRQIWIKGISE